MDDTLAKCLVREKAIAVRLYWYARAVQAVHLEDEFRADTATDPPPPCGVAAGPLPGELDKAAQDPSLNALVDLLTKLPQGNMQMGPVGGSKDIALLYWWATFGDFEIRLKRRLPDESLERPQRRLFARARKESTNAKHFENGRRKLTGGLETPLHPIAWYVKYAADSNGPPRIDSGAVGEAIGLHATGGWRTWQDVLVEFYDAFTRAASLRFASALAMSGAPDGRHDPGPFAQSPGEMAGDLGLVLEAAEPTGRGIELAPCGSWPVRLGRMPVRQAARVANRRIIPISASARPRAYLDVARLVQDKTVRGSELIKQATDAWPEQEPFGDSLAREMRQPTQRSADAVAAIAGLLTRALQPDADVPRGFTEKDFLRELRTTLQRGGVDIVASESSSRLIPARFGCDGAWAVRIPGLAEPVSIGTVCEASCPGVLFDAIDRCDQYVWSCVTVAAVSGDGEWGDAKTNLQKAGVCGEPWERVKAQLLGLQRQPSAEHIVRAFYPLREIYLSLRRRRAKLKPEAIKRNAELLLRIMSESTHLLLQVMQATLRFVGDDVNDVRGGLYPPRHLEGDRAGDVDVAKWLDEPWWSRGPEAACRVDVRLGSAGVKVDERFEESGRSLTLSIPFATEADETLCTRSGALLWLAAGQPPDFVKAIHDCLGGAVKKAIESGSAVDFTEALAILKTHFSSRAGSDAFHAMVDLATRRGDDAPNGLLAYATACWTALRADPRGDFPCFPEVEQTDGVWRLKPPSRWDKELSWSFSPEPPGTLLQVRYAGIARDACRVLSRGPIEQAGLQGLAAAVDHWCASLPESPRLQLGQYAEEVVRCSDLHQTFGESLDSGIQAATELLGVIARADAGTATISLSETNADDGFAALKAWLDAADIIVEPEGWSAGTGASVTPEGGEKLPAEFNDLIPEGNVLVRTFGVVSRDAGTRFSVFGGGRSAGPQPANYRELLTIADAPGGERFLEWLRQMPEKRLKGADAFRSHLYDLYYKISMAHYARLKGTEPEWELTTDVLARAKQGLEEMYETTFECTAFPKEQDVVKVYHDVQPDEVSLQGAGQLEADEVRVAVRGFRSKGKVVSKARVFKESTT